MSNRLLTSSVILSAFLLIASKPKESGKADPKSRETMSHKPAASGTMVRMVHPVADLVVPVDQAPWEGQKTASRSKAVDSAEAITIAQLSKMIRETVEPSSWRENGGRGTMVDHKGIGMVIYQTNEVQEQVDDLLNSLRRIQNIEVALELRLIGVPNDHFERIHVGDGLCAVAESSRTSCDEKKLRFFLQAAQGDNRTTILQAPNLTVRNGQTATIAVTQDRHFVTEYKSVRRGNQLLVLPKSVPIQTGVRFAARPVVSADRRSVTVNLDASLTELDSSLVPLSPVTAREVSGANLKTNEKVVPLPQAAQQPAATTLTLNNSFQIPDGKTMLVSWGTRSHESRMDTDSCPTTLENIPYINTLFRTVGYGRENQNIVLLITPRIIVAQEEEVRVGKSNAKR